MSKENNGHRSDPAAAPATASGEEYKVGPGRPPRQYQFKPGQSGNPKGAKRKAPSIVPDLKAGFERALKKTVTVKQGGKERKVTMGEAGIEQLVAQFAKGDHRARRDVFWLADRYDVDLLNGGGRKVVEEALASNHAAILLSYVQRQYDKVVTPPPVFAPPELLDDDQEEGK
jgi:hypothetical protein